MKKQALTFIFSSLLMLMIVPAINITLGNQHEKEEWKWWSRSVLYNFDLVVPHISRLFYPLGISMDPSQVIIGKKDWLFLGDEHGNNLSFKRSEITAEDKKTINEIHFVAQSWDLFLKHKGVELYKIMVGADKESIYPEYLPDWAKPTENYVTDLLFQNNQKIYFDTRPALKTAKSQFSQPLYYQTDTHWNSLGAWVAFNAFMKEIAQTENHLHFLAQDQVQIISMNEAKIGDLTYFLRMDEMLHDKEITLKIDTATSNRSKQYDYKTGHLIVSSENSPIDPMPQLILVKSNSALNKKKVLWIRDSFGNAMSPYMFATFSDILQLHYKTLTPTLLSNLIDSYQPDYVFITIVERQARNIFSLPPMLKPEQMQIEQ